MKKKILLLVLVMTYSVVMADVITPVKWYTSQPGKEVFWKEYRKGTERSGPYKMADLGREAYINEIVINTAEDGSPAVSFLRDDFLYLVKKPEQWSGPLSGSRRGNGYVVDAHHELARYIIVRSNQPVEKLIRNVQIDTETPEVTVSSMNIQQTSSETAVVFSTNIAVQAQVSYEEEQVVLEKKTVSNVATSTEVSREHRFVLQNLKPGTAYWYVIITTDIYGNKHETPMYRFVRQP